MSKLLCSKKIVSRPVVNLDGPATQAIAANHGNLTILHAVDSLKQLYPNLPIETVDSDDADKGWIEPGGRSVINLRNATLETPFHEVGHLWEAVLNEDLSKREYDSILDELEGSAELDESRRNNPELAPRDQRREALIQMVALASAQNLGFTPVLPNSGPARSLTTRIWELVRKALTPLLGPVESNEQSLQGASLKQVLAQGVEALTRIPSARLSSGYAATLIRERLNQRASAPGISSAADLVELLSGQDPTTDQGRTRADAKEIWGEVEASIKKGGKREFKIPPSIGGKRRAPVQIPAGYSKTEIETFIAEKLAEAGRERRQELGDDAVDFFGRPEVEQLRMLRGDYPNDAEAGPELDEEKREKLRLYFQEIQKLFPDYQPGDEVMHYTAEGAGDLYTDAVNSGGILLHKSKRKDPGTGEEKTVVSLAMITDAGLGETRKDKGFLNGLYDKRQQLRGKKGSGFGRMLFNASARYGFNIRLAPTHENRLKSQVLLAGMHLRKQGYQVNSLAVGTFNKELTGKNQVARMFPTEHLQMLQQVRDEPTVAEMLSNSGASGQYLKELLSDDSLFDASLYNGDYLEFLGNHYTYTNDKNPTPDLVRKTLGDYHEKRSATSANGLEKAIRQRLREIVRNGHDSRYQQDPEFLMLSDALVQLKGISYHTNPWHVMDRATQLFTSFLRNTNPIVQYFVSQWDNQWYNVTQDFFKLQEEHQKITEALHADYRSRHAGVAVREHIAEADQSKYYDDLFRKEKVEYYNSKTEQQEEREINTRRMHLPDSEAFKALTKPQQDYIRYTLKMIKQRALAVEQQRRNTDLKTFTAEEQEKWYQENWADGRVPIVQAGVWQSVLKGDVKYATEEHLRSLLEDNPRFHDQQRDDEDRLSDYLLTQSDDEHFNRQLGLQYDKQTGQRLQLRSEDGAQVQNQIDGDIRNTMNIWLMSTLKHELTSDLELDMKVGVSLIRHHEHALGLVRASGTTHENDAKSPSEDEKYFVMMARQIWLNRTNQGSGRALEQRLAKAAAILGSLTSSVILMGNVLVPVQTFLTTTFGSILPQALARQGFEGNSSVPDAKHVAEAIAVVSLPGNWDMLQAMANQLGVTKHGEYDLLSMRQQTGEPFRVLSQQTAYSLDHFGDMLLRMTVMVAALKQQGAWPAYSYSKEGQLVYDVTKDRRTDAVKKTVRDNLIREGVLTDEQPLDRAFDGFLRRTMELVIGDMMGGYSPGTQTILGATGFGNQVRKMAGYLPVRIERAIQEQKTAPNQGTYADDGTKENEVQKGQARSLLTYLGLAGLASGTFAQRMAFAKKKTAGSMDELNMRMLLSNLTLFATFAVASGALASSLGADDTRERRRYLSLRLLDAMVAETFALENFRAVLGKAANPFIMAAFMKNMVDGVSDQFMPGRDSKRGWHQAASRVGFVRMIDIGANYLESDEK